MILRHLHKITGLLILGILFYACSSSQIKNSKTEKEEPVVISNDSLEYEIIIIDVGFTRFLNTVAQPMGYYSQAYLENRNRFFVNTWNMRVNNPNFSNNIYQWPIDYNPRINYGMEVNYKLFNYFMFAQQKYKIRLDGGIGAPLRIR